MMYFITFTNLPLLQTVFPLRHGHTLKVNYSSIPTTSRPFLIKLIDMKINNDTNSTIKMLRY